MDKTETLKTIAANVATAKSALSLHARHWAARYNASVYLVGSIRSKPEPRDIDIRIIIPDHEFAARYGHELRPTEIGESHPLHKRQPALVKASLVDWNGDGPTQRWIDDIAKFGAQLSLKMRHNIDLQIWPDSYWREPYPPPILLATPSPCWFFYESEAEKKIAKKARRKS